MHSSFKQDTPCIFLCTELEQKEMENIIHTVMSCSIGSTCLSIVWETFIITCGMVYDCQIDRIQNHAVKELLHLPVRDYLEELASGHTWGFID